MKIRRKTGKGLVAGGTPRVNLLPPREIENRGRHRLRLNYLRALILTLSILVLQMLIASGLGVLTNSEHAAAVRTSAQLQSELAKYSMVIEVRTQVRNLESLRAQAGSNDQDWRPLIGEIKAALPKGVALIGFKLAPGAGPIAGAEAPDQEGRSRERFQPEEPCLRARADKFWRDVENAAEKLKQLLEEFASRKRPVRVVRKRDFRHQRWADLALRLVTLNGQKSYLTNYVTTLGHTIYVPDGFDGWPAAHRYQILRHELIHVLQFERLGWLGMIVIYGILPLPMGLAYGRARLEWEAYAETLRAVAEVEGIRAARTPQLRDMIVRRFTGPDYGWMWPFPKMVRRWIAEELDRIESAMI